MKLQLNGEAKSFAQVETVSDLVNELQILPETVLIEHNGRALYRAEWPSRQLREGDRIELLRLTAGG